MDSQESSRIAAALALRVEQGESAQQVSLALVKAWQDVACGLRPLIGDQGVIALYKRSVYLSAASHGWLADLPERALAAMDLEALGALVDRQSRAAAVEGGASLLRNFHALLVSLVGPSLTERLLDAAWAPSSSGPPAQDIPR